MIQKLDTLLLAFLLLSLLTVSAEVPKEEITLDTEKNISIYLKEVSGTPVDGIAGICSITLPEYRRAVFFASPSNSFDNKNQMFSWPVRRLSDFFSDSCMKITGVTKPANNIILLALELEDGGYMVLQGLAHEKVMSWMKIIDDRKIEIQYGSMGKAPVERTEVPILAYGKDTDLYRLLAGIWTDITKLKGIRKSTALREQKDYPEIYEYLGWCSWEHFHKNINEKVLCQAIRKLEDSNIPIRWVLIDDGHQTQERSSLISLDINRKNFPDGWGPILSLRSDKLKWFGLWHCMYGLWNGISLKHEMPDLSPYLVRKGGKYITDGSEKAADAFYDKLTASVSGPGFDFTKIDVQTGDFNNQLFGENAVEAHRNNASALEYYARKRLEGLMNCMAQNLPCVLNTRYSATTRVSIDYHLNDKVKACNHIYQGFQNTPWMGQTVWPDHDMFHSSDSCMGRLMAVSKAVSAAPIYLSDNPDDFKEEYIGPLAFKDGRLLRPMAPGTPLPHSFFDNPLMGNSIYQVIAPLTEKSAAIVSYNISHVSRAPVSARINADDYRHADAMCQPYPGLREIPEEGLVYYDWYRKKGDRLTGTYDFQLSGAEDRLVILSEIEDGWAVIGAENKYLSPLAVTHYRATGEKLSVRMVEITPFLIYSAQGKVSCSNATVYGLGNGFYRVVPADNRKDFVISRPSR